jgi:ribonuclease P protein component
MTVPHGEGFPRTARVRRRREYLAIGRTAQRRQTRHFVVLSARREDGARLGITVSRKIGGAVVRNTVKRRVREIFRRHPEHLLPGHDIVVIAKPGAGELSFADIATELAAAVAPRTSQPRRT